MSIGFTQLILLLLVAVLLFGNIPKLFKELSTAILTFKQTIAASGTSNLASKSVVCQRPQEEHHSVESKPDKSIKDNKL